MQKFISEYIIRERPYAKTSNSIEVVNQEGGVLNLIPSNDPYHVTTWRLLYNIFKNHLLKDTTPLTKYETEKCILEVKPVGDKIRVVYSDGKSEAQDELHADLVIVADGAHSTIRESAMPHSSPQYVGYVTWRGVGPATAVSDALRKVM
jgi:2-polyprenyl-6-methoxyphenol hydroxylase-like FAD-dependent oxidoreductase